MSAELVSAISVLGDSFHHEVRNVGEFGHQKEQVLLNVLRDFVGSADVLATGEAEGGDVRDGVNVAC